MVSIFKMIQVHIRRCLGWPGGYIPLSNLLYTLGFSYYPTKHDILNTPHPVELILDICKRGLWSINEKALGAVFCIDDQALFIELFHRNYIL